MALTCDEISALTSADRAEHIRKVSSCELCGEPMPAGEETFKFHGYSGPCPKQPLPKTSEWRPIETAPRDGTPFLCFTPSDEFSAPTGIDLIWYEPSIKSYTQDGDNEVPFAGITHWMPLPEPPPKGSR